MENINRTLIDAKRRAEIFAERFGDEIDAADTLAELVRQTGEYLSRIIGKDAANDAMAVAVRPLLEAAGEGMDEPSQWRDALLGARSYCYSEWPLGQTLHDLAAYALYGIVLDGSDNPNELEIKIGNLVHKAQDFLAASPVEQWGVGKEQSGQPDLIRLIRLATNRWALDHNEPVEPAILAAFGGVSEGRIRNMMAGSDRRFQSEDGRIPAHEALAWLASREEFWNSIWREQSLPSFLTEKSPVLERPVFVPVARDDTVFHPGLNRSGIYTIGEKGSEVRITDFQAALRQLQAMSIPFWRRPNLQGNWGIVRGTRWARMDESDLAWFAADPQRKLAEERVV